MAAAKQVYIAVVGAGGVGKCFLSQLHQLAQRRASPELVLCYVATSSKSLYDRSYSPLEISTAASDLLSKSVGPPLPLADLTKFLASAPAKTILVDNTSSQDVADAYPNFLSNGISVITPNKKAFSGSIESWDHIFSAAAKSGAKVYHESTVCAGLPILSTLRDLVDTGDEVTKIEGVFSGTMSFLFNSFAPLSGSGGKWSEEVKKAKELGYTEPDPRDDLNGMDVARKLTILARIAGLRIESTSSFPVQSLIPKELETCTSGNEFVQKMPDFDHVMAEVRDSAAKEGRVVRYVGSIDVASKKVEVGLKQFKPTDSIAALQGAANVVAFYTKRYGNDPVIIQGAGAGGEVTAMGITSDLLKVLSQI